jgi:uncharacterized protein
MAILHPRIAISRRLTDRACRSHCGRFYPFDPHCGRTMMTKGPIRAIRALMLALTATAGIYALAVAAWLNALIWLAFAADFAVDLSRAYNDYLYDRFLRHESRLKGMAVLPLQDIPAAVSELRRAVKKYGMVGGVLPADGLPQPLGHPEFHAVYEEANRLGCMLAVHAQNSLRNNDLFMWRGEAATLAHVWPQMRQFTNLMFSGLLGRLPDLKIAFLEAGCGWVPYLMSKMGSRMGEAPPPANLIERGQIYFQCGEEMTTRRDLELLGDECLFWASDFPHEGIVDMKKAVFEFLDREDIPEESKRKISYDNPKRLYRI